jgi:hypothetical protein
MRTFGLGMAYALLYGMNETSLERRYMVIIRDISTTRQRTTLGPFYFVDSAQNAIDAYLAVCGKGNVIEYQIVKVAPNARGRFA